MLKCQQLLVFSHLLVRINTTSESFKAGKIGIFQQFSIILSSLELRMKKSCNLAEWFIYTCISLPHLYTVGIPRNSTSARGTDMHVSLLSISHYNHAHSTLRHSCPAHTRDRKFRVNTELVRRKLGNPPNEP